MTAPSARARFRSDAERWDRLFESRPNELITLAELQRLFPSPGNSIYPWKRLRRLWKASQLAISIAEDGYIFCGTSRSPDELDYYARGPLARQRAVAAANSSSRSRRRPAPGSS